MVQYTQSSTAKRIGVLRKTTLVDFPGRVACAVFFTGCNLRCPYCYNKELVLNDLETLSKNSEFVTEEEIIAHLEKRKSVITGLVLSGGEALLSSHTEKIIKKAKKLGYKIKLDTNGTLPEKLKSLINCEETKPDFIALDFKTSPEKYSLLLPGADSTVIFEKINQSIKIIENSKIAFEIRTVLHPLLTNFEDLKKIASQLPQNTCWRLARFTTGNCIDESYNKNIGYTETEYLKLEAVAKELIKDSELR